MSSNAFVLVQNAERIITRARLVGDALEVHFADGAHGILPADVVKGAHRGPPTGLTIPTSFKVVLRFGRSATETFPWDYLRGFCDPGYERRARASADKGRRVLGQRIRELRRAQATTQAGLAAAAGIGRVTLARIEAGVQSPSLATLEALARGLQVVFADLVSPQV